MSALSRPLSQIGTEPDQGVKFLTPYELADLFRNPGFYEAANVARQHGAQFERKNGKRVNTAVHELFEKQGRAARLHAAEQAAATAIRAKTERSNELAKFL
ncbi:hypothetical protein CCP3SC15_3450001 [Gammaproteobacteria bacterium]